MQSSTLTDAELVECDEIEDAVHVLKQSFGDQAPAEALTRAVVQERIENRGEAMLWAKVYLRLVQK